MLETTFESVASRRVAWPGDPLNAVPEVNELLPSLITFPSAAHITSDSKGTVPIAITALRHQQVLVNGATIRAVLPVWLYFTLQRKTVFLVDSDNGRDRKF